MTEPTKEQLDEAFSTCIEDMKIMVAEWTVNDKGDVMNPMVMMLMRTIPDKIEGLPFDIKALDGDASAVGPKIVLLNPHMITPEGQPCIPIGLFWKIMKVLGIKTNAFGMVIGMEAWTVVAKDRSEMPQDLSKVPGREESCIVTAEREGTRSIYKAKISRDSEGKAIIGPWEDEFKAEGRVFNSIPGNVQN